MPIAAAVVSLNSELCCCLTSFQRRLLRCVRYRGKLGWFEKRMNILEVPILNISWVRNCPLKEKLFPLKIIVKKKIFGIAKNIYYSCAMRVQ